MANAKFIDSIYGAMRRDSKKVIYFKTNRGNYIVFKNKQGSFILAWHKKRKTYLDMKEFNYPMRLNFGHRVLAVVNKYVGKGLKIKLIEDCTYG